MLNITYELKDVAKIYNGSTPSSTNSEYYNGEIIWITPKDLSNQKQKYITQGERNITQKGYDSCTTTLLPKGTVLLSSRAPIGLLSIAKNELCTNQGFKNIVTNEKFLHNEYLYYYLKLKTNELTNLGSGTTFKEISKSTLELFKLNVSKDVNNQQKIANVLSSLDSKIELNNKINKELEAMAKTIYDYWFVQFDFPDINGEPYKSSGGKMVYNKELKREIPEGWEVKTLNTITNIIAGGDKPKDFSEYQTSELSIPIYSNGIENEGLYGFTNNARINNPSITISARGTIGYCCLRFKPYLPIVRLISVTPKIQNQIVFFYQAIKNLVFENSGSVQQQLTVPQVSELKIVLPPEFYLTKFEKIGILLFSKIENIKQQNQELAKLRDWLLPMLMNGQVKVK